MSRLNATFANDSYVNDPPYQLDDEILVSSSEEVPDAIKKISSNSVKLEMNNFTNVPYPEPAQEHTLHHNHLVLPKDQNQHGQRRTSEPYYYTKYFERKRIDFVLAVSTVNLRGNDRESDDIDEAFIERPAEKSETQQTLDQTREIFFKNLEERYGLEVDRRDSPSARYYLIHAPFKVLEKYATKLTINKPIDNSYLDAVNKLFTSARMRKRLENMDAAGEKELDAKQEIETMLSNVHKTTAGHNGATDENAVKVDGNEVTTVYSTRLGAIFVGQEDEETFFTPGERIKIVNYILEECPYIDGDSFDAAEEFGLASLLGGVGDVFTKAYPLHDSSVKSSTEHPDERRAYLNSKWLNSFRGWFWLNELEEVRQYFGEKIGLYFAWLQYYVYALVGATVVGFIPFIFGLATIGSNPIITKTCDKNNTYLMCPICAEAQCDAWYLDVACNSARFGYIMANKLSLIFGVVLLIGSMVFIRLWERREYALNYEWNLTDLDNSQRAETLRPQYRLEAIRSGHTRPNKITSQDERVISSSKRAKAKAVSAMTLVVSILVVLVAVFSIIIYKSVSAYLFQGTPAPGLIASLTSSIISAVIITILHFVYDRLAIWLTSREHHRTEHAYEISLTYKMFWFSFFNYYSPLFYIAFFKDDLSGQPPEYNMFLGYSWAGCPAGGCTSELSIQIFSTLLTKYIIYNNTWGFGLLWLKQWWKTRSHEKRVAPNCVLERWEEDFLLENADELSLFHDYLEMVLQYGFVILFCTAFAFAPILALINTTIQLNLDARKYLNRQNRPVPDMVTNIGAWHDLMRQVSNIALLTNSVLIGFTTRIIPVISYSWEFDGLENYVQDHLVAFNTTCYGSVQHMSADSSTPLTGTCYFKGQREETSECDYTATLQFWKTMSVALLWVIGTLIIMNVCQQTVLAFVPSKAQALVTKVKKEAHYRRVILNPSVRMAIEELSAKRAKQKEARRKESECSHVSK